MSVMVEDEYQYICPNCGLLIEKFCAKGVKGEDYSDIDGDEHTAYLGIGAIYPGVPLEDD